MAEVWSLEVYTESTHFTIVRNQDFSNSIKNALYSLFSRSLPKLRVMICKKSSFEIHTNPEFKPELTGEARWLASQPIEDFKPGVME